MTCHYCPATHDLRPYGPKGAMVCFSCAMGTPERKAETERNFAMQLEAAGPIVMLDGTEVGPYPAKHARRGDHCQNGGDVCLAGGVDGICCPEDSCDIDDGIRKVS